MEDRLTYFDAAKGIGIVLIVCNHLGIPENIPLLYSIKVALFFVISGFFFATKSPFKEFIFKDYKRLIIPFLFFYIFSYFLFYLGLFFFPDFSKMTDAKGILDCFTQKQYFNGPLWFLLSLFWIRIFTYFIRTKINRLSIQIIVSLVISLIGFSLGKFNIDLPLSIDTSLTYTPVFFTGIVIRKYNLLDRYNRNECAVLGIIFYISCFPLSMRIADSLNRYGGSYFSFIYFTLILSFALLLLTKSVLYHSRILSFIGVNSLWIMCTHHLYYRPIKLICDRLISSDYLLTFVFLITMILCCCSAPLVNKFCPIIIGNSK